MPERLDARPRKRLLIAQAELPIDFEDRAVDFHRRPDAVVRVAVVSLAQIESESLVEQSVGEGQA